MPRLFGLSAVLWLALLPGCGGSDPAPAPTKGGTQAKGPASPEEAVQLLAAAAKAGDVDKALAQLTPSLAKMKKTLLLIGSEEIVFASVLESKFGRDIAPISRISASSGEWRDSLRGLKGIEVKGKQEVKPDRVLLTLWEQQDKIVETKVMALKDAGGWKLDYQRVLGTRPTKLAQRPAADGKTIDVQVEEVGVWSEPDPKAIDAYMKALEVYQAALGQISRDVSTAQYGNREDAEKARRQAADSAFTGIGKPKP